jgi:sugar lactone lactonase YvrE
MRNAVRWVAAFVLTSCSLWAQKSVVVTVAGGYVGDHKSALEASLEFPTSVAFDREGNLYVADSSGCRIRIVNSQGTISTFAGTGICGFSGDGGKATSAMLSTVFQIAFDANGSLFVADNGNSRIRVVSPSGVISTVAGNGTLGYSGDGGPAQAAALSAPAGLAVDPSGNLYIADTGNHVIRLVDTSGTIHTIAGNGTAGFSGDGGPALSAQLNNPQSVAVDAGGNYYIGDSNQHLRKVDASGTITTIAGNGNQTIGVANGTPATSAAIGVPLGLLVASGQLYIAGGTGIWSVDLSTGLIYVIAGGGQPGGFGGDGGVATAALFSQAYGTALDGQGNLFVADAANNRVRKIAAGSQIISTVAGGFLGDGRHATDAGLDMFFGGEIAFDANGNLYIADTYNNRVRKVSTNGVITTFAGTGISGSFGDGGPAVAAGLSLPSSVAIDTAGNVYIADHSNGMIRKVDTAGTITSLNVFTTGFPSFFLFGSLSGMAFDSAGNLYASDGLFVVWKIDPAGNGKIVAGLPFALGSSGDGGPATQATLFLPSGIAIDRAGNLYISEWLDNRVRKVDTNGIITTVAGSGVQGFSGDGGSATAAELNLPVDVAVDAAGNLYIADFTNLRIRKVDTTGTIQTIAGTNGIGYNGERLAPTLTNMVPAGLTFSPDGNLFLSDSRAYRVREIRK